MKWRFDGGAGAVPLTLTTANIIAVVMAYGTPLPRGELEAAVFAMEPVTYQGTGGAFWLQNKMDGRSMWLGRKAFRCSCAALQELAAVLRRQRVFGA